MDDLRIGIVGGSITGCTIAIAASRAGLRPVVFERRSDPLRERGAGLGVPTATCIGLRDQGYIDDGLPHVSVRALEHSSRLQGEPHRRRAAGQVPTWLEAIRWGHLYDRLRSLVPGDCYFQGRTVLAAAGSERSATLVLEDGTKEQFDLVVFADGYRSLGRDLVSPGCVPGYRGYFIWRGGLSEREFDAGPFEGVLQRVGFPGGHFFAYLLPGASGSSAPGARELNWGMFLPVSAPDLARFLVDSSGVARELSIPPGRMRVDLERDLKRRARALLPDDFAAIVGASVDTFGQGIVAALPHRYRAGRLCLAGDAGAVAPPFTTSGVFKGMKNAAELVSAIAGADPLDAALEAWEKSQQRAGRGLQELSELMEDRLIRNVPDFSALTQEGLNGWWSEIQTKLESVMG